MNSIGESGGCRLPQTLLFDCCKTISHALLQLTYILLGELSRPSQQRGIDFLKRITQSSNGWSDSSELPNVAYTNYSIYLFGPPSSLKCSCIDCIRLLPSSCFTIFMQHISVTHIRTHMYVQTWDLWPGKHCSVTAPDNSDFALSQFISSRKRSHTCISCMMYYFYL